MILIENLVRKFGERKAVDGISLKVERGEIFGFLGMNGAGKTTTLRILAGILQPTSGRIEIGGVDLADDPRAVKRLSGYIPDRPYLYGKLTAREFLSFVAELYEIEDSVVDERIDNIIKCYQLANYQDQLVESYSHGMKQRLATCAALMHQPQVLIVDEPMVGLDPHGAKLLKDTLKGYAEDGMTVFLSTHSLAVAEELCHRLAIIHRGRILAEGTLEELRAQSPGGNLEEIFLNITGEKLLEEGM